MTTTERNKAYAEQMARELDNVLALLSSSEPAANLEIPEPDLNFDSPTSPDFTNDPINDFKVGDRDTREVRITPVPAARTDNQPVETASVINIPIVQTRYADPLDAMVPVVPSKSNADAQFAQYLQLLRAANSQARASGNFVATVVTALGEDGSTATEANLLGFFQRIYQALFAAEQGATASALPRTQPLRVVQATLADFGRALDRYPELLPVYLPRGLGIDGQAAVLSLLVYGGAADYTWRYRGAGIPAERANSQPSVVRWAPQGGFNRILAVTPDRTPLGVVGGGALTLPALRAVEAFYRRAYGNDLMDAAAKSVFALAGVYFDPTLDPNPAPIVPGTNFEVRRVTRTSGGVDYGGFPDRVVSAPADGVDAAGAFAYAGADDDKQRKRLGDVLWTLVRHAIDAGEYDGEDFVDEDAVRTGFDDVELFRDRYVFHWHQLDQVDKGDDVTETVRRGYVFDFARQTLYRQLHQLTRANRKALRDGLAQWFDLDQNDVVDAEEDDDGAIVDWEYNLRNVYGAKDCQQVLLAAVDITTVVGVVAGYLRPASVIRTSGHLNPVNFFNRARLYIGHLHLQNFAAYVKGGLFPADLHTAPLQHARYLRHVPAALRSFFLMTALDDRAYPEENWWVLESPYFAKGVGDDDPFAGYGVKGTWNVDASGRVSLFDKENSFAAIEGTFRGDVQDGARIDALAQFGAARFAIIRARNGLINALPFAPRIRYGYAYDSVTLVANSGISSLTVGRARTGHFISCS